MKTYIISVIVLGFLSIQVMATECLFREVPKGKTVYVVPMYQAEVNFMFDKKTNEAFALTNWSLDSEKTKDCFKEGKEKFPTSKLLLPSVKMADLTVRVMGQASTTPLHVSPYPDTTGQWSAQADLIKIPFSSREEIESAIQRGDRVIEIDGNLRFRMTEIERSIIGQVECTKKAEEAGVLNLFRRFGEIKAYVENRSSKEDINVEEVMEDFLQTCVVFQNVNSDSLIEFDLNQRTSSRIVKGTLSFKGNVTKEVTRSMPTIAVLKASILDI